MRALRLLRCSHNQEVNSLSSCCSPHERLLGMVLARSCALSAVSLFLAVGLGRKPNTVRQQLREFCYEAKAKRGGSRQALQVEACFAPLLAWVLSWGEGNQLAVALDATTLGQRFVVLVISVLYRGCALPVAWTVGIHCADAARPRARRWDCPASADARASTADIPCSRSVV
jgi:hypothetical protein